MIEPEPKQQRGVLSVAMASPLVSTVTNDEASQAVHTNTVDSVLSTGGTANWWDSGND
jgi:hypothetical protein